MDDDGNSKNTNNNSKSFWINIFNFLIFLILNYYEHKKWYLYNNK